MTGKVFGRLVVLGPGSSRDRWVCKCVCGKQKEVRGNNLRSGGSTTCGCGKRRDPRPPVRVIGDVALVPIGKGRWSALDLDDWLRLPRLTWVCRNKYVSSADKLHVPLHHAILGAPLHGMMVDHADGDPTNNRKANLRICSPTQNSRNMRARRGKASPRKSVSKHGHRWRARIQVSPSRRISLGVFDSEEEAARAYDAAAKKFFGEFANSKPSGLVR